MIRSAVPEDAPGLARVHVRSWQAAYPGLIDQTFLDALDIEARTGWWERALTRDSNLVAVAEVGGGVEGFCLAGASVTKGWGEIYAIYVSPEHWGAGHGHGLLAAGEDLLVDAGFDRARLWVLRGNERACMFYERQGWSRGQPIRIESIGGADVTEFRYEKALTRT